MKAGSRDHLNGSSEALGEEDGSSPNDVSCSIIPAQCIACTLSVYVQFCSVYEHYTEEIMGRV